MTTIKAGEIWIAAIPFTNGIASKKRPVLILWDDGNDIVLAAITSAKPRTQTDVVLKNWANSGLRVESTVRLSRLDCIEKSLMISKLGKLSVEDANKLKEIWTNYVKPQF
jgi:mRNA interferase MazF